MNVQTIRKHCLTPVAKAQELSIICYPTHNHWDDTEIEEYFPLIMVLILCFYIIAQCSSLHRIYRAVNVTQFRVLAYLKKRNSRFWPSDVGGPNYNSLLKLPCLFFSFPSDKLLYLFSLNKLYFKRCLHIGVVDNK